MDVVFRNGEEQRLQALLTRPALPWASLRRLLADERRNLARGFDRLLALDELDIKLYDHQRDAVLRVLREMRGRALLADEVGLGKTVEAGVVLKEYMLRGLVRRALVLAPASLTQQWRDELREKLHIEARVFDADRDLSPDGCVVASLDTAKRPAHAARLKGVFWDAVVVDEAHRLKNRSTEAWRFVDALRSKYLLLLTATPIQNDLEELYNMLTLLKPGVLETYTLFRQRFMMDRRAPKDVERLREHVNEVMIRTTKRDSKIPFPRRVVRSVPVRLGDAEKRFYEDVLLFSRTVYSRTESGVLPLILLLRELCSSPAAARRTLTALSSAEELPPVQRREAAALAGRALALTDGAAKLRAAVRIVRDFGAPVVVFTEFLATQSALCAALADAGVRAERFHGGMTDEERRRAVQAFRERGGALVSTEAGGEGQNWQFCSAVLNYDLPWNPMRVEQRIGRVHRLGQSRDVLVVNMYTEETVEEHVYRLLRDKVRLFEQVIGDVDVILGTAADEEDTFERAIGRIILEAATATDLGAGFSRLGRRLAEARRCHDAARRRRADPTEVEAASSGLTTKTRVKSTDPQSRTGESEAGRPRPAGMARLLHPLCTDLEFVSGALADEPNRHPALAPLADVMKGLNPGTARIGRSEKRIVHHRHLLLWFKVAHRSDETREYVHPVLVDPVTEDVRTAPELHGALDLARGLSESPNTASEEYALRRLYTEARRRVRRAAVRLGKEHRAEARARRARERERLEGYCAGLREEALAPLAREMRRLEAAGLEARLFQAVGERSGPEAGAPAPDLTHRAQLLENKAKEALRAVEEERRRRLEELNRKYAVRAEVSLFAAAWLWTPRVEVRLKPPGISPRELALYYDPLQRALVDPPCDVCGGPLHAVRLCRHGCVACETCFAPCAECGAPLCRACVVRRCHVCDAALCAACGTECTASRITPPVSVFACPSCRRTACRTCGAMEKFLVV